MKRQVGVRLSDELLTAIDDQRGRLTRTAFIEAALEEALSTGRGAPMKALEAEPAVLERIASTEVGGRGAVAQAPSPKPKPKQVEAPKKMAGEALPLMRCPRCGATPRSPAIIAKGKCAMCPGSRLVPA